MERIKKKSVGLTLETLQGQLHIDTDELDQALVEQPDLYYHVAERYATAVAERDAAKLDLEQATAEIDEAMRRQAAKDAVKLTETALQRRLSTTPRIQELERDYLKLRADADRWQALKEAYQQRSFMLRELVAMLIAKLGNLSLERGVAGAHCDLAEANHARAADMRRQQRKEV